MQVSHSRTAVTLQPHHDATTVLSDAVAQGEGGVLCASLHHRAGVLRHLDAILVPGDARGRLALEGDLDGGRLARLHRHRLAGQNLQHRGVDDWRICV